MSPWIDVDKDLPNLIPSDPTAKSEGSREALIAKGDLEHLRRRLPGPPTIDGLDLATAILIQNFGHKEQLSSFCRVLIWKSTHRLDSENATEDITTHKDTAPSDIDSLIQHHDNTRIHEAVSDLIDCVHTACFSRGVPKTVSRKWLPGEYQWQRKYGAAWIQYLIARHLLCLRWMETKQAPFWLNLIPGFTTEAIDAMILQLHKMDIPEIYWADGKEHTPIDMLRTRNLQLWAREM